MGGGAGGGRGWGQINQICAISLLCMFLSGHLNGLFKGLLMSKKPAKRVAVCRCPACEN